MIVWRKTSMSFTKHKGRERTLKPPICQTRRVMLYMPKNTEEVEDAAAEPEEENVVKEKCDS